MSPDDREPATDQHPERIERMMQVLSLAVVGEYGRALDHCGELREDSFGMVEEGLRIFIRELMHANGERERALAALQQANREIAAKLALIESQREAIRELSSPILDVWDGVVAVPIVGAFDHDRARVLLDKLLHRVVAIRARWALVDLTGVDVVDAATADHLVGLVRALRLVGGRCVITGMSPAAAESFASLGDLLGDLRCLPNLREGLRHCLLARTAKSR